MKKRRKTRRKSTSGSVTALALLLFGAAGYMACNNRQDGSAMPSAGHKEGVMPDSHVEGVTHYPGLETVSLPDGLAAQMKEYIGFTISFNKDNGTPNYVAWELLGEETSGEQSRSNKFWTDSEIDGCPTTKDYSNSGYDRGHMCPAADQKWSREAMEDCFVMANICPQLHALNAGAWATLENKERQWAQRDSAIMIIAGPIYDKTDTKRIGEAGVRVPGAFFKVLAAPYADRPRGIAFVYPNMTAPGNMQDYAMSIDDLEKITGYDFFQSLPDDVEESVERSFSFKDWNSTK
jgi:endonuclease G